MLPQTKKRKISVGSDEFVIAAHEKLISGTPAILCIHGIGCSKNTFSCFFNAPHFSNYSIIAPDLLGFGESDRAGPVHYTLESQSHFLLQYLDALKLQPQVVIAHSMGGALALLLLRELPARPRLFINLDGNLVAEDCGLVSRRTASFEKKEFVEKIFPQLVAQRDWDDDLKLADAKAFYEMAKSLVAWSDSGELLSRYLHLDCRKFFVIGEKDQDKPVISKLPAAEVKKVKNVGHFMIRDNEAEFLQLIFKLVNLRDNA